MRLKYYDKSTYVWKIVEFEAKLISRAAQFFVIFILIQLTHFNLCTSLTEKETSKASKIKFIRKGFNSIKPSKVYIWEN